MSADLFIWDPAIDLDPRSATFHDRLEELSAPERKEPASPLIRRFVSDLIARYPDLTGDQDQAQTIWTFGPLPLVANGGSINLTMTMEGYGIGGEFIVATAHRLGLDVFDPQGDEVYLHDGGIVRPHAPTGPHWRDTRAAGH